MKGMANRQKRIVRAQENIQKRLLERQRIQRQKGKEFVRKKKSRG